ncbi:DUF2231 domain-containing protein [Microbacterium sp. ZW T5_56]|uniref:DUF2231 domain-containing protein n=1 Tax=Microbacterium sp. ZW T5_56 TaxID=3378081 RepID=UPI003853FA9F
MTATPAPPDAHRRSKTPRTALAGPYGHPLHAAFVTIPIGAWFASLIFDVIAFFARDPAVFAAGANTLIIIGLIGAVLAAVFGLIDLSQLAAGTPARRTAITHMTLNLVVVVLFVIDLVLRVATELPLAATFVLSLVALATLGVSGWLGGKLAYHFGVRVADESAQATGFR